MSEFGSPFSFSLSFPHPKKSSGFAYGNCRNKKAEWSSRKVWRKRISCWALGQWALFRGVSYDALKQKWITPPFSTNTIPPSLNLPVHHHHHHPLNRVSKISITIPPSSNVTNRTRVTTLRNHGEKQPEICCIKHPTPTPRTTNLESSCS